MALPKYVYKNNIPQGPNRIPATQKPINSNFQAINEILNVNHVGFNDANQGKHKYLTLPFQLSVPVTTSNQMSIYSATSTDGNSSEIFFTYPAATTGTPLTGLGHGSLPSAEGWCYLAGSVLMKWGNATGITTGANVITFPVVVGTPVFTSTFIAQFVPSVNYTIPAVGSAGPYITNITTTGFTLNAPTTISSSIYWYAIGV